MSSCNDKRDNMKSKYKSFSFDNYRFNYFWNNFIFSCNRSCKKNFEKNRKSKLHYPFNYCSLFSYNFGDNNLRIFWIISDGCINIDRYIWNLNEYKKNKYDGVFNNSDYCDLFNLENIYFNTPKAQPPLLSSSQL